MSLIGSIGRQVGGLAPVPFGERLSETGGVVAEKLIGGVGRAAIEQGGQLQLPPEVPPTPDPSLGVAGRVFKHEGLTGSSLQLHPGFYAFDQLEAAGLHDEITSARIKPGYRVIFYSSVEGGQPAGQIVADVTGPTTVDLAKRGANDVVSSIAVFPREGTREQTGPGGDTSRDDSFDVGPEGEVQQEQRGAMLAGLGVPPVVLLGLLAAAVLWIANR